MKYFIVLVFLFSTNPAFSTWKETENNLVRFICQKYSGGEPHRQVFVVEQLSVDTVDGSLHIAPDEIEGGLGEENRFRMRMYMNSSLISSERTKEEIIKDLLNQPASLDRFDGTRMDYEGVGYRWGSGFSFVSDDESIVFGIDDLENWRDALLINDQIGGGILQCEEPELFPEKILVED